MRSQASASHNARDALSGECARCLQPGSRCVESGGCEFAPVRNSPLSTTSARRHGERRAFTGPRSVRRRTSTCWEAAAQWGAAAAEE